MNAVVVVFYQSPNHYLAQSSKIQQEVAYKILYFYLALALALRRNIKCVHSFTRSLDTRSLPCQNFHPEEKIIIYLEYSLYL